MLSALNLITKHQPSRIKYHNVYMQAMKKRTSESDCVSDDSRSLGILILCPFPNSCVAEVEDPFTIIAKQLSRVSLQSELHR